MDFLQNFLNHGTLPFIGRDAEIQRLVSFWSAASDLSGPQALLIIGEAGIGKSRLIDELTTRILTDGGIIIHAKFIPGATLSPTYLIAEALRSSRTARQLLKSEPEDTFESMLPALRRLARLRPTLFVLEDVHLLPKESLAEIKSLLDGMAAESVKFLFVARPASLAVKGVIESILIGEIDLGPLNRNRIAELWERLFNQRADAEIIEALELATLGNPLALRSALRGALQSCAIAPHGSDGWGVRVSASTFRTMLERYVNVLSEGMAASLTAAESALLARLSLLGEIFARETANAIAPGCEDMIDSLISKGILVTSEAVPLLPGFLPSGSEYGSSPTIRFAHTLLHRHVLHSSPIASSTLAQLIGADWPLHSTLPFTLLSRNDADMPTLDTLSFKDSSTAELRRAFDKTLAVMRALRDGPTAHQAEAVYGAAERLLEALTPTLSDQQKALHEAEILYTILYLYVINMGSRTTPSQFDRLMAITANPTTGEMALRRMLALGMKFIIETVKEGEFPQATWEEFEELFRRFPLLSATNDHVFMLSLMLEYHMALSNRGPFLIGLVERSIMFMTSSESLPWELRHNALQHLAPCLLSYFDTPEQLEQRLALIRQFDELPDDTIRLNINLGKIRFYDIIGFYREMEDSIRELVPTAVSFGFHKALASWNTRRTFAKAAFGINLNEIDAEATHINRALSAEPGLAATLYERLLVVGLLRNDIPWTLSILDRVPASERALPLSVNLIILFASGASLDEARTVPGLPPRRRNFAPLIAMMFDSGTSLDNIRSETERLLNEPILALNDLLAIRAVVDLVMSAAHQRPELLRLLRPAVRSAALDMLRWLDPRGLFAYMDAVLQRFEPFLLPADLKTWRQRIELLTEDYRASVPTTSEHRVRLSMIGDISVHMPGADPVPVRGARNRALLALMVANQMLIRPLLYPEFCAIASGISGDPEYAQRFTRMAISRLRSLLGRDAVLTNRDTPRLNPDLIRVDLLEAQHLIDLAVAAVESRSAFRAYDAIIAAIDLTRGEVPFPTQYESFFEAARDDFEHRVRSALLSVGQLLLSEGDHGRAEEVLRRGFEAMPDDTELAELLGEILIRMNRRAEAERLRMKLERLRTWEEQQPLERRMRKVV